jgi:hydantoinase/carbamoylase family amidase
LPDHERIAGRLQALWEIARGPAGGADRPAFSSAEAQAMLLVAGWAREAGLEPGIDGFGNLWALPAGWSGPLVTSGSHVDTVPDGGRYDGALGTVLGLELVHDLGEEAGADARVGLLVCAAEEAPRFGAGTIGSRLLVGTLPESALDELRDETGTNAADAREEYLGSLAELPLVQPPRERLRAHAEVHVAQRRALRELGVVTRVASPRRFAVRIAGQAGHSGEVSMEDRHDALAAAAELVLAVEAAAQAEPPETVATVASITVEPGAVSVIPGRAVLAVDVRAISGPSLDHVEAAIRERTSEIAARRGVSAEVELVRAGQPVELDRTLAAAALKTARRLGIAATETWSGAGHDAQHLAALMPTLLLFVPLHGGESHTPAEGAKMDEIVHAAAVVRDTLLTAGAGCETTLSSARSTRRPSARGRGRPGLA